eukprot:951859_1
MTPSSVAFIRIGLVPRRRHSPNTNNNGDIKRRLEFIQSHCDVVRIIAHSQVKKLNRYHLGMKKAHIMEIQVNGGADIKEKVEFGYNLFEKQISIDSVFHDNESIDTIAVTRGHGWKGVVNRWGVTRLPRKTHRGLRKVACIGSWHPARVQFNIAREGQKGYHLENSGLTDQYGVSKAAVCDTYHAAHKL